MEVKVGKTIKLTKRVNSGAFGEVIKLNIFQVFHGINQKTNMEVAVKLEPVNTRHPQLFFECKLY